MKAPDEIRAAFAAHPRHRFIPDLVWPEPQGLPLARSADPRRWAAYVYDDDAVVTQANDGGSGMINTPSSSSSAPEMMAGMIEAAGVAPGARVLEIGTGTGWNAAVLASLVGPSGSVTSVEIEREVAEQARERLAGTGVRVIVGAVPTEGVYDAVIATCSAHRVPLEWVRHLSAEGVLVLPWAPYESGGPTPIAALSGGREGRFTGDGSFMRDRTQRVPAPRFPGMGREIERKGAVPFGAEELLERDLLTRLVLASPGIWITLGARPWQEATAPIIALEAGESWAYLWPDGSTTGGGPSDLPAELAEIHAVLDGAGWPELTEFTLEVLDDRPHRVRAAGLGPWDHHL
ncbi:methyltransferase domain-containing protein [Murinocardiopsis flavida]|nr:methyltransferase domain-containing protein [Murinocardiopsis flavida]